MGDAFLSHAGNLLDSNISRRRNRFDYSSPAGGIQNLEVVHKILDGHFPMVYLFVCLFQKRELKWLLSDMHGCRRETRIWPARSPSCRPPAAATSTKRRPRARRAIGPRWRR